MTRVQSQSADTATLEVSPVDRQLPAAKPGQFHMLWAFGVGEVPISASRLEGVEGPVQHTIRAVGSTTRALCALEQGDAVGVRGPFGRGWDLERARGGDVVVVAGGLGLAPLKPAVEAILADRDAFSRVVVLIGARSPDDLLFAEVVADWRGRFDLDVSITVDHAGAGWHGDVGVVTGLLRRIPVEVDSTSALVCGPEIMMRFAGAALTDLGISAERIQVSLERNMVCGIGQCGHCQLGPTFLCREGPVYGLDVVGPLLEVRSL